MRTYERSPQWRSGRFENPDAWPKRLGLAAVLKWQLSPGRPRRPSDFHPPFVVNDGARVRAHGGPSVTWIGHATALLGTGGAFVLTDPIFSDTISGFLRRFAPPGLAPSALPPIDAVVISHNHRDHLDEDSIVALGKEVTYVVPLGLAEWFLARGLDKVRELDWWESTELTARSGKKVRVTLVPAQHWSRRGLTDENRSLWGGYVIEGADASFYFAGDTGYPAAFVEIGRRFPGIDFALLPIGAYEPRWFMCSQHISPEDAARAFVELGARSLVPIHWGTFFLSDEPMDEPPRLLRQALKDRADQLLELAIGQSHFGPPPPSRGR
jgi:L-ascorbate metabolism protein UlaG (beta-lactamase superfamily)